MGEGRFFIIINNTCVPGNPIKIYTYPELSTYVFFATSRSYILVGNIEHFGACALAKRLASVSSAEHVVCKRTRQYSLA
jgi:hypothetical protein